jgi:hypothetical protein
LRHRVGRHDGRRRCRAAVDGEVRDGRLDAGQQQVHGQAFADQPGRADDDVAGREPEDLGDVLGGAVGVLEAGGPVQALAPPELSTTASDPPVADDVRDQVTGAASTRLVVKTAAAWWWGRR